MDKLVGVHPTLVEKVNRILKAMTELGFPMFVTDGVRSLARQQQLWAQGRTQPGPIVTYADGIIKKSRHQIHEDGWGHAVDMAFLGDSPWSDLHPWTLYGMMVTALGLKWGGNFSTIADKPHAELA